MYTHQTATSGTMHPPFLLPSPFLQLLPAAVGPVKLLKDPSTAVDHVGLLPQPSRVSSRSSTSSRRNNPFEGGGPWTIGRIRSELSKRGVRFPRTARKESLIKLLNDSRRKSQPAQGVVQRSQELSPLLFPDTDGEQGRTGLTPSRPGEPPPVNPSLRNQVLSGANFDFMYYLVTLR